MEIFILVVPPFAGELYFNLPYREEILPFGVAKMGKMDDSGGFVAVPIDVFYRSKKDISGIYI
jgi:hypothetical protein